METACPELLPDSEMTQSQTRNHYVTKSHPISHLYMYGNGLKQDNDCKKPNSNPNAQDKSKNLKPA